MTLVSSGSGTKRGFFPFLLWSFRLNFSASYFFFRRLNLGICRFVASGTTDAHVSLCRATKLQSCVTIHNSPCCSDKIISHLSSSGSTQIGDQRVEGKSGKWENGKWSGLTTEAEIEKSALPGRAWHKFHGLEPWYFASLENVIV